MKRLYDSLRTCAKEEEVKAEFCKFFKMKIFALRGIDHYAEHVLFEFKYDRNFKNPENVARVLAQTMYYARLLKFGAGLTRYPLPPVICVVDKNEAFFAETKDYAKFYAAKGEKYDWDRAPSTPCPKLVEDVLDYLTRRCGDAETSLPYIYDLTNPAEEEQFVKKCRERLTHQATFLELLDKKAITEENFLDVFDYWDGLFGAYVRNGRKSSEYFFADIEQGKSIVAQDGRVLFSVSGAEGYIPKTIQPEKYKHFWQNYEKVPPPAMTRIRQKADRLTEDFRRRFTGEFYTPVEFAANEDRFLAKWLNGRAACPQAAVRRVEDNAPCQDGLSSEARAVLDAARQLYRDFYANITHTPWMDWKIETWDAGYYQIRNATKTLRDSASPREEDLLRKKHDALGAKLLPQIYSLGFLNPDVEYFR